MDTPVDDPAAAALGVLDSLEIVYTRYDHPPVFTVEQALEHWQGIDAAHCKNLFLRNKKGNRHYLVVAEHDRPVSIQRIAEIVGDDRLSFGSPERLMRCLGLTPGSVSPLGLINDAAKEVRVVVDAGLRDRARVGFHPNVNTATVVMSTADFERFLGWTGNPVQWVALSLEGKARLAPGLAPDTR
jgi:Ala-tRNA(Pro) deacylase